MYYGEEIKGGQSGFLTWRYPISAAKIHTLSTSLRARKPSNLIHSLMKHLLNRDGISPNCLKTEKKVHNGCTINTNPSSQAPIKIHFFTWTGNFFQSVSPSGIRMYLPHSINLCILSSFYWRAFNWIIISCSLFL